jgi:hypothetical protein
MFLPPIEQTNRRVVHTKIENRLPSKGQTTLSRTLQQRPVTVTTEVEVVVVQCDVRGCGTELADPTSADLRGWLMVGQISGPGTNRPPEDQHFCPEHAPLVLAKVAEAKR